jgi:xylono-1,5-lactonase
MQYKVALDVQAELGEGLHWDAARGVLWMVDIHGRRLLQWDLESPTWREWRTPQRIGWAIPRAGSDELLLGLQEGMALAVPNELPSLQWVARPFEGRPELRLNDAKADALGAVWAGSMNNDDEGCSDGCLFRLSPDGKLETVHSGYRVANGPAIHPDGHLLLHTDSARRTIYAFDFDAAAGQVSNRRVWKRLADDEGYPDGMCFDAEGCLWVAHWGAGCVSRFSADGTVHRCLRLPATHVTNVCFAGPRLDRLFVSSAFCGLNGTQRAEEPRAGALFEILEPGVAGLPGLASGMAAA